jgi:hypothetical protein
VSTKEVSLDAQEMEGEHVLLSSETVLGNGTIEHIHDIVYLKREGFDNLKTHDMRDEVEKINEMLISEKKPYLLVGFGRWGTSDPSAGVPVRWGQISGAKAIVEASLAHVNFEQSQGSHFFHNVMGCGVSYFSIPFERTENIDWQWLEGYDAKREMKYVRHIRLEEPLYIKVNGRSGRGVIMKKKP